MRNQDFTFTIAPTGGNYTFKLVGTCRTPGELAAARDAIIGFFDVIGSRWDDEELRKRKILEGDAQE